MFLCNVKTCFLSMQKITWASSIKQQRGYLRVSSMFPKPALPTKDADCVMEPSGCLSYDLFHLAGLIQRASPGSFYMTPDLTRSLEKLYRVIDKEMRSVGAQKLTLPCLAPAEIWSKSQRWAAMGSELLKLTDRHGMQHCLAPTHEEAVTELIATMKPSYKHLPIRWYQISRKFRDELRPKHGLLRGREFEMKDLYCFDADEASARLTYDDVSAAYERIYKRLGLQVVRVAASSGAMGGDWSHEYHVVSEVGEDKLLQCMTCRMSFNHELMADKSTDDDSSNNNTFHCSNCQQETKFETLSAIEISHSFLLGTKYSKVFDANYTSEQGKPVPFYMSCYGIGVTRLLAAAAQVLSRDDELRWPRVIAPYQVAVVPQRVGHRFDETLQLAEQLSAQLSRFAHLQDDVILDDRHQVTIGRRVSSMRALGVPHVIAVGRRSLEQPALYEYIDVYNDTVTYLRDTELVGLLSVLDTEVLNPRQPTSLDSCFSAAQSCS